MDSPVEQLMKSMDELSSLLNARMAEFEKNLQQPSSSAANLTVKDIAPEFYTFKTVNARHFGYTNLKWNFLQMIWIARRLNSEDISFFHDIKEDKYEDALKKIITVLTT
ncbi:unnamed protein product [Euphydryas editha]|uniref:Uncharacterized protein n=1 Tax=Euphydryas editha TaxID=104508 RepID=A0AAU9VFM4_EUPED|nr:unnamed protein product [Euphydryas editha]